MMVIVEVMVAVVIIVLSILRFVFGGHKNSPANTEA